MASHTRVVPAFSWKGWLSMGLLIGAFVTLGMFLGRWGLEALRDVTGRRFPEWAEVALVVAFLALLIAPALTVVQRAWPIALLGAIAGGSMILANFAYFILSVDDGGVYRADMLGRAAVMIVGFAIVSGVLSLVLLAACRAAMFTIRHRDSPTCCWGCGYELTHDPRIVSCPECAHPRSQPPPPRPVADRWRWLQRRARPLVLIVLLPSLAWCSYRLATVTVPLIRFRTALETPGQPSFHIMTPPIPNSLRLTSGGCTAWREIDGFQDRILLYTFTPRPARGEAPMRLFIAAANVPSLRVMTPVPSGTGIAWLGAPDLGTPIVCCELDARQSSQVMSAGGAPPALIRALIDRAAAVHWAPAGMTPRDEAPIERLDPAPYLGKP